jgi:peroxiredoxin Q/BCP
MALLEVGEKAPDFALPSQSKEMVRLSDFLGKNVVLYFYPKDFTAGCTAEAKAFRESYQTFYDNNTEVIGVSADSVETHELFAQKCGLPFKLLSDTTKKVREMYGATSLIGPGRVTYVIDSKGTVRFIFNSLMRPTRHVREALEALKVEKENLPKTT